MSRRLRWLFALLAGSVLLTGCGNFNVYELPLPGGADLGSNPITVKAQFSDVLDLVPKSSVKVDDITVGQISSVELDPDDPSTALVTMQIRSDTDLPADTDASIRQTSLLGEKFVSLEAPSGGGTGTLADDTLIPLSRTGRNPEIEEVLGALSLVLNGGGVAQLKTIASEVNQTLGGREDATRSLLTQLAGLTGELDDHRGDIVSAIESLNRLSVAAKAQQGSINSALDNLPSALDSLDSQRQYLIQMLNALDRLSGVGVRVIKRSKADTFATLRQLQPVLDQLANSGSSFVNSLSTALTFPFVDAVVGRDPQVARNLQVGDYTNLSVELDLDLGDLPVLPGLPCVTLNQIPGGLPLNDVLHLDNLCQSASDAITKCVNSPSAATCAGLPQSVLTSICAAVPISVPGLCTAGTGTKTGKHHGKGGLGLPGLPNLPSLPGLGGLNSMLPGLGSLLPGLNRTAPAVSRRSPGASSAHGPTMGQLEQAYDPSLVRLLTPGMVLK